MYDYQHEHKGLFAHKSKEQKENEQQQHKGLKAKKEEKTAANKDHSEKELSITAQISSILKSQKIQNFNLSIR